MQIAIMVLGNRVYNRSPDQRSVHGLDPSGLREEMSIVHTGQEETAIFIDSVNYFYPAPFMCQTHFGFGNRIVH